MEPKRWYMCDPAKNTACKKRSCKENPTAVFPICDRTSDPACAVMDEANQPMELPEKPAGQALQELSQAGNQNGSPCK